MSTEPVHEFESNSIIEGKYNARCGKRRVDAEHITSDPAKVTCPQLSAGDHPSASSAQNRCQRLGN